MRRGLPVVVVSDLLDRIEADVLVLKGVDELVGDGDAGDVLRRALDDVEDFRPRIVVADDLLLEEIRQEWLQLERVRDHAEALVRGLLAGNVAHRLRLGELLEDELPNLRLRAHLDLRRNLELEADRLLDHRDGLGHFLRVRAF